ncbi:MAG: uroporphyrinogen-III decarboxylase-like protein [Planctomycetes bacterium]|nr:uroporphyrinogen-III decarboxylase-like protein [Planctomycetota bacterium]
MTRREVVRAVLEGRRPPYVPWSFGLTVPAREKLRRHGGGGDPEPHLGNHILGLGSDIGFFDDLGGDLFRDVFGVVWDRRIDKDIGNVRGCLLPEPTLRGLRFPDPLDPRFFSDIPAKIARHGDRFRVFRIGFSLYERAWTLRGMENLLVDFEENPGFVRDLFDAIADYNISQVREALRYDIDAVYFGDDWGFQRGLQMGPDLWHAFLRPVLARMYGAVRAAGKFVMIHSCGAVAELFDALIEIGVSCFNPFQPEVMDVADCIGRYRGRLAFHGGLSTQETLPRGTPEDVRREAERLIALGRDGGYIFAPAHDVPGDVPLENILAFIEVAQSQPGAPASPA